MNILVLNYEFPPLGGGAAPISYSLAKGYVQQGHRVDVITMGYKDLKTHEKKDGMNIYRVPCLRKRKEMTTFIELFSYIIPAVRKALTLHKKYSYDVCHCHFALPTGVAALIIKQLVGIPYVLTVHGSDVPGYNSDRFKLTHVLTLLPFKLICKQAKRVTMGSKFLQRILRKSVKVPSLVIPNAVDTTEFKPGKKEPFILAVGRLQPLKGFQHLLQAVHEETFWPVYIAGAGPYEGELKKISRSSTTPITFLGWQSKKQMIDLYARASIFVLPSEKENSSLALLEAMSAGCAVITTNSTGSKELLGSAGELVAYGDSKGISQKLHLIQSTVDSYTQKSLERSKELDIRHITSKYLEVLS